MGSVCCVNSVSRLPLCVTLLRGCGGDGGGGDDDDCAGPAAATSIRSSIT